MKYIKRFFLHVIMAGILLYVVDKYFPGLWFSLQSEYANEIVIYLFVGIVFWLINVVLKSILKLITLPISALTFGLFSLVINFLLLYIFEQFVNYLDVWVVVLLGNVVQVFILSCLFSLISFLIKKI